MTSHRDDGHFDATANALDLGTASVRISSERPHPIAQNRLRADESITNLFIRFHIECRTQFECLTRFLNH